MVNHLIPFLINFIHHQIKRRYSCNLQIIHGNLRSVSPDRVAPLKYSGHFKVSGPLLVSGFFIEGQNLNIKDLLPNKRIAVDTQYS